MRKMTLVAALSVLMALCASQEASAGAVMCFPPSNTAGTLGPRTVYNNSVLGSAQVGQSANNPYSLNSQGCAFINDPDLQWAQAQGALPQTVSGTTIVYLPGPSVPYPVPVPGVPASPTASTWQHLWIGGGGNVDGLSIPPGTGVQFARTDAGGAYVKSGGMWQQLLTQSIMPVLDFTPNTGSGVVNVIEIAGCNNDAACMYMYYNGYVYHSANISTLSTNGTTLCRTDGNLAQQTFDTANIGANSVTRGQGPTLAVDPNNKDHVILGTSLNGLFETFNGTACGSVVWTPISTASIPLSNSGAANLGSHPPGYRIAFDPTSTTTCHTGAGTCSAKAYIFTFNTVTPGVYATSNAGTSWALTSSGPVNVGRMKVSYATLGGGNLWVTEGVSPSHVWRYSAGTWLQTSMATGASSIAIDPANGDHLVANFGSLSIVSSTNAAQATPAFTTYTPSFAAGDAPWLAKSALLGAASGSDAAFAGSLVMMNISQGPWTTPFFTSNPTMTASAFGIEELVQSGGLQVSALGTVTVGVQDQGTCRVSVPYSLVSPATDCGQISDLFSLYYAAGLSQVPDHSLMFAKIGNNFNGGFDASGTSTDGFLSDYTPLNSWIAKSVALGSITNNGSGLIRVTVPSTTGLTTWAAGAGSIVCGISSDAVFNSPFPTKCFTVTVIDGTTIDLQNTVFTSGIGHVPVTLYSPVVLINDYLGAGDVLNVTNDAGTVKVTTAQGVAFNNGYPVCITGVTMTSSTVVNGCWITKSIAIPSMDLTSSTFVGGDTYTGGGSVKSWNAPGGGIAAASSSNWTMYGSNKTLPYCTDNGGATWSQVNAPSGLLAQTTVNGGPYAAGSTSFTVVDGTKVSGNIYVYLNSGRIWTILASSMGSNGWTKSGNTITLIGVSVPIGDSIATGAVIANSWGYPNATFIYATVVAADQVTPNTFYAVDIDYGLLKWTHCGATTLATNTGVAGGFQTGNTVLNAVTLKAVPGEAGHLFYASGPLPTIGTPTSSSLYRSCNGVNNTTDSVSWTRVPGFFGAHSVGFGAAAPNATYPAVYVAGYRDPTGADLKANAVYGVWRMIYDLNHGSTGTCDVTATWQAIGGTGNAFTLGWPAVNIHDVSGDPFAYGFVYFQGPYGVWMAYAP